jgi:hypothetical protein
MSIPDPCEELQSSKISVDEVDINGVKYYYMIDKNDKKKIHIFQYDDAIKGYIPLQSHEEPYSDIMRKLLKI